MQNGGSGFTKVTGKQESPVRVGSRSYLSWKALFIEVSQNAKGKDFRKMNICFYNESTHGGTSCVCICASQFGTHNILQLHPGGTK